MARKSTKHLLSIAAISFLIVLSFVPTVPVCASPWEILAGETEIIDDGAVHVYAENIVVYGTLIIRNGSTLRLSQTANYEFMIDVREGGQLVVEDSTVDSNGPRFHLWCRYESSLTFVNSSVRAYYVYVYYTSSINVVNSTLERTLYVYYSSRADLTGLKFWQANSYVYVYYRSEATIAASEFYAVYPYYASKAVVTDSKIRYIYAGYGSEVSVKGSETYYFYIEYGSYGSIEHSTIINNGYLYAYEGSTLIMDHVAAAAGTSFYVYGDYSNNEIHISNSAGIYEIILEYGNTYCTCDNITMTDDGDFDIAASSYIEVMDSTVGDYAYFRSNSTGKFTNVVSANGFELDIYRGSQVYVNNLTYLADVDLYGGSLLVLDKVHTTSDADIYLSYGGSTLVAMNSQLGDYLTAYGGKMTLINVTLSDPNLDDGYFYVEYGAVAYLDNVTLSDWDYFYMYEGAEAWIMNSNFTGHDSSYFYVESASELFVEETTINFAWAYIEYGSSTEFRDCDITIDPYDFEIYEGAIAEFYNCHIFANDSIWVYEASIITLVDCDVSASEETDPPGIYLEDSSSAIIQNTDLDGTLYISDLPNATIINSILNINYTGYDLNATQWLHLYDSTVNVIALEIYHLHNHLNASTINMIDNTTYREIHYGITAIVKDDYGQPIPDALVEIYDSLDNLIFSGYTDSTGKSKEIFPALGTYTIKAYAGTKEDSSTVTLTNICIEETFTLDITTPWIGTVTQDPTTPDYTEDVDVSVEIYDPSGILSVTLYYNNGAPYSTPMSHVSGDIYRGTIPAQAYNTHISYYIVAEDNSHNTATSDTYDYTVIDDTFPSVSITSPTQNAEVWGTVTINFTASDDYLTTVLLHIDNEEIDVTGQTSFNWNSTKVGDGSHTIKIIATDEAGNTEESEVTITTTNLARTQDQVDDLEDEVDDLKDQVDELKGSVGIWQGLSIATFVIGLLAGAAIVFFMKRRSKQ